MDFDPYITLVSLDGWASTRMRLLDWDDERAKEIRLLFGENAKQGSHFNIESIDGMEPLWHPVGDTYRDLELRHIVVIARRARLCKSPQAFLAWIKLIRSDLIGKEGLSFDAVTSYFQASFRGEFASLAGYARQWADGQRWHPYVRLHIDWDGLGRSLTEDAVVAELPNGKIAVLTYNT
ncbi:hypothetical protein FDA94_28790 [Herbidospora galbida]|uniref:Uncharacterized protein n=1 Tax=Herbidospora galbida TaxID=2575442 RepID=A0A4U3M8Q0_9ACTN|nr:hypothetical protein [Herbidospora galbida]TKK84629.1 hypothetical protein FDA94_28790 [Herbidospora galbida]